MFSLIIDNRERALFSHIENNIKSFHYEKMQLNTGDYLIVESNHKDNKKIRACIERKTYKDLASSFRDGRYKSELNNMINMRKETNCQLFFIIEGAAFPSQNSKFSRIPYSCILGAINKLMIRDNIFIIQTKNEAHTAQKLNELLNTMQILYNESNKLTIGGKNEEIKNEKIENEEIKNDENEEIENEEIENKKIKNEEIENEENEEIENEENEEIENEEIKNEEIENEEIENKNEEINCSNITFRTKLTKRHIKSDKDVCMKAWATLNGISLEFSNILISKFSIKNLLMKEVSVKDISELKTALGRKISKIAITSLLQVRNGFHCEKMLSSISGITVEYATLLLKNQSIIDIILMGKEESKNIIIDKKKLGLKKAEQIEKLFNYINE